jgi:hypothetical protein
MASLAARANAEKLHYFTLIQEQTKFHREALANIERYVFEMQQKKIEAGTLEQAVKGLERTVVALSQIAIILLDASRLWRGMEESCKALQKSPLITLIESAELGFSSKNKKEERIEYYRSDDYFKREAVEYLGRWQAIKVVCDEYKKQLEGSSEESRKKYLQSSAMKTEDAKKLVPELAKKLLAGLQLSKEELDRQAKEAEDNANAARQASTGGSLGTSQAATA